MLQLELGLHLFLAFFSLSGFGFKFHASGISLNNILVLEKPQGSI